MVSEFRKKKLTRGFDMLDSDQSGTIEKADFDKMAEGIAKARGWQPGNPKHQECIDTMAKIWAAVQKQADGDNDGKITRDEWLAIMVDYANKPPSSDDFQTLWCKFLFSVQDTGNDGKIDIDEFVPVVMSFGRSKEAATEAFKKLSNGKPSLSYEEFEALYREYFTTDDPNAPGNYIFGGPKE